MRLLSFFRRWTPIRDAAALSTFVDENAAFLAQKGIYEYSRARAGHYSKVLFAEAEFRKAVEASRWRAFPLGLAMVGEVVEGVLASTDTNGRAQRAGALTAIVLSVFDRYPVPAELGEETWSAIREDLKLHLQSLASRAPKLAMDVPLPFAQAYFDAMPIDKKLRKPDFPSITSYLRVTLCNIHDEFEKRLDRTVLASLLRLP